MVDIGRRSEMRSLVDHENGLVSREIFVSDEIYQQELEQIFARTWLFIGHTSQIPNPNDFFISRMGEESVIMTRDRQGEVHVLLNTCRHRGMKVIRYDRGNTPVFTCPYHGWSYSTDGNLVSVPGELIGVPQFATAYHGDLKKEEWGLISVPKMHVYKGSVWACWDKDAPEWDEYMGDIRYFLDNFFEGTDGDPEGRVAIGGVQKWIAPHNWKFGAENFVGDEYHGVPTHRSAHMTGNLRSVEGSPSNAGMIPTMNYTVPSNLVSISFKQGHGVIRSLPRGDWESTDTMALDDHPNPEFLEYFKNAYKEKARRKGGYGPQPSGAQPSTIFPNISPNSNASLAVWHPAGPSKTETWRWYFFDKNAPKELRTAWRNNILVNAGPTGRVEKDDEENWVYATSASHGTIARRHPYNYEMGIGHGRKDQGFPQATVFDVTGSPSKYKGITEENARGYYKRWAQLMDAKDWNELRRWDDESR